MSGGQPMSADPPNAPALAFTTLGCKLNHYETEAVAAQFVRQGWRCVPWGEPAELLLVDTCTVTDRADQKARQLIRTALRRQPEAVMVVMGCYGQVAAEELANIPGVDWVVGNGEKRDLPTLLGAPVKLGTPRIQVGRLSRAATGALPGIERFQRQTRAYLKIQDGCDVFCSFCIVPFTRGRSRSLPADPVLSQAKRLLGAGHRELVLTGVHIGDWGRDLPGGDSLASLCRRLLALPRLDRLRLSSIEPWDIDAPLIDLMAAEPRFCSHLHTAIQSGSSRILAAMGRPMDAEGLRRLFTRLAERLPGLGLGTDVLVGFPGEGEPDFRATEELLREFPFTYLHVFPYSPRRGTRAARLADPVPAALKRERCRHLLELGRAKRADAHHGRLGQEAEVLLERASGGRISGFTPEYLRVEALLGGALTPTALENRFVRLRLVEDLGDRLRGEWVA
jgi:threonylcarbamoyladenosine tRNA methylthiotransferase MtaB